MPCFFIYIRRILSIRYRNTRGQTITTIFDLEEVKSSSTLDKNSSYLIHTSLSLCHQPPLCKTHSTHPALTLGGKGLTPAKTLCPHTPKGFPFSLSLDALSVSSLIWTSLGCSLVLILCRCVCFLFVFCPFFPPIYQFLVVSAIQLSVYVFGSSFSRKRHRHEDIRFYLVTETGAVET